MEMSRVLESFENLCANPWAWAVAAAIALKAIYSFVCFLRCPVVNTRSLVDAQAAREATNARRVHSPRFLAFMTLGIVMSVGGLYLVTHPELGPIALAMMTVGVFVMLVEPSRLTIGDNTLRVVAARAEGADALSFAMDRLKAAHTERLALEFGFAILIALVLLAY